MGTWLPVCLPPALLLMASNATDSIAITSNDQRFFGRQMPRYSGNKKVYPAISYHCSGKSETNSPVFPLQIRMTTTYSTQSFTAFADFKRLAVGVHLPSLLTIRAMARSGLDAVTRKVTLSLRRKEWLNRHIGGAFVARRRQVHETRHRKERHRAVRPTPHAAGRFMGNIASSLPDFENATGVLFAENRARFDKPVLCWSASEQAKLAASGWSLS